MTLADIRPETLRVFPEGFLWGAATSSYEIDGALSNARLMKSLGATAYRFAFSWPRIFPSGSGGPHPKAIDFYSRLLDELVVNGVQPFATLNHWDLPPRVQERGGWETRETAHAFADFAGYVAAQFGDRIKHFFTLNELFTFMEWGHGGLNRALRPSTARLNQVRHHALLAHGLAGQSIRAHGRKGTHVGVSENLTTAIPVIETPDNVKACEVATRELNAGYLTVLLEGRYTDAFLADAGADAPQFSDQDLRTIASPLDFVGINVFQTVEYVRAAHTSAGYETVRFNESPGRALSPWYRVSPEALYWAPRNVQKVWNVQDIFITENGSGASDVLAAESNVSDSDRIMFLRAYLTQLQRATAAGIPVRGYFQWSPMDNFEWSVGCGKRFGLIYVDYTAPKRTPKLSASFYKEVIARNKVV